MSEDVRDAGYVDFLIVGAGISGIGAAHHMRERFPGRSLIVLEARDRFRGSLVHPQRWPQDLDVTGKRIVVIGSGATAATLIPAIAQDAEHVTMVQRSPSYFFAPPGQNELAVTLESLDIPEDWTHEILRRAYIARFDQLVKTAFDAPEELRQFFIESMRPQLPEGFDIGKHFTPRYRPWQQRIGIVPDGDFFAALRTGKASIVTDTIEAFTEAGLRVSSGDEISADIIVTATGFTMSLFGGIAFAVDGEPVDFTERLTWRGLMISGVPSMAYVRWLELTPGAAGQLSEVDLDSVFGEPLKNLAESVGKVRSRHCGIVPDQQEWPGRGLRARISSLPQSIPARGTPGRPRS